MDDPTDNNNDREEGSSMPPLNNNNDGVSMNNNNSNNDASSRDVHHDTSSVNNDNNISNNHMQQQHRHPPSSSTNFTTSSSSSPNNNNTRPKSSNQLGASRQSISMTYQNNNNNLQQHPNLPFLVTHWLSQYAPPPSSSSSSEFVALEEGTNTNNNTNNNEREEALQLIRQQATQLANAFQTLGAFGQSSSLPASSTNNNVNSNSGSGSGIGSDQLALLHGFSSSRPTTYADLSRKYSNLLSINNGIKSNNNDTEGRRGTTLLDALIQHAGVSSSSALLSTNNTMKHHVLPWSLLVAAYEGCVPTEEESRGLLATTAASDTTNEKNVSSMSHSGRKSGKFYGTGRKVGGGEDYYMPSSSGNGMPLLDKERCDNSSIHAAHASRHQLSLRMEAIHQRKEMEGTNLTLQQSMKKQQVATSRRSEIDMLEGSDSELNNLRRIVAQLEVRTKELNSKYELTKVKVREAIMETNHSYSNWTCIQRQYDDACKLNGEYPSSSLHRKVLRLGISNDARRRNLGYGALAHAPGKNNIGMSAILSRQYHNNSGGGGHHVVSTPTTSSETTLSVLKSRLSHAVTISSHLIYPVYCLKFDKTGRYFITGSDDQTAKVFHIGGGEGHGGRFASPSFNYGANARGAVLVCTLNGHAGVVTDIDVSADNALLATSSMDGDVRVWRLRDGCPVAILRGHKDGANMVRESRQMLACFCTLKLGLCLCVCRTNSHSFMMYIHSLFIRHHGQSSRHFDW